MKLRIGSRVHLSNGEIRTVDNIYVTFDAPFPDPMTVIIFKDYPNEMFSASDAMCAIRDKVIVDIEEPE